MQSIFTFLVSDHKGTNTVPTSEVGTSTYYITTCNNKEIAWTLVRQEFYSSMWDYVVHITEVLFFIQVKIPKCVGKKICIDWNGNQT
jgi:hypothetical protein